MKDVIEQIIRAIVDHPEEVVVKGFAGAQSYILEVTVSKADLGQLIGRRGATASAIRTLLAAASGKHDRRYILEIVED